MNAALLGFLLLQLACVLLLSQSSACAQIRDPDLVAVRLSQAPTMVADFANREPWHPRQCFWPIALRFSLLQKPRAEIDATGGGDDGLRGCQLPFALGTWKIRQGLVKRPWQLRPTCAA